MVFQYSIQVFIYFRTSSQLPSPLNHYLNFMEYQDKQLHQINLNYFLIHSNNFKLKYNSQPKNFILKSLKSFEYFQPPYLFLFEYFMPILKLLPILQLFILFNFSCPQPNLFLIIFFLQISKYLFFCAFPLPLLITYFFLLHQEDQYLKL